MMEFIEQNSDLFINIFSFVILVVFTNYILKNMQKGTEETKKVMGQAAVDTLVCTLMLGIVFFFVLSVASFMNAFGIMTSNTQFLNSGFNIGVIALIAIYFVALRYRQQPKEKQTMNIFFPLIFKD